MQLVQLPRKVIVYAPQANNDVWVAMLTDSIIKLLFVYAGFSFEK